jgi:hypothetical protein
VSEPTNVSGARRARSATAALRLLKMCPSLPVDTVRHLAGFQSSGGAYGRLEKLRHAGLADVRYVDLGYLVSDRPIGLWDITETGLRTISGLITEPLPDGNETRLYAAGVRGCRKAARTSTLTTRVAAYRLLAYVLAESRRGGQIYDVCAWEHPWVRIVSSPDGGRVRVELPAVATLALRGTCEEGATAGGDPITIVLVPDLGAAPVMRYREMLRRLVAHQDAFDARELKVVVGTVGSDEDDTRARAWRSLLRRIGYGQGVAICSREVTWSEVYSVLGLRPRRDANERDVKSGSDSRRGAARGGRERAPGRAREQLLHLVGRHPFLTVVQLAQLLGTTTKRIRRLEDDLVTRGWLRHVELEDLQPGSIGLNCADIGRLGLVEITLAGRRQLASWLGLDSTTAARYHGLIGEARSSWGRRRRLLRSLAHTLGANAVFVAFALAAEMVYRLGGTDRFAQWRGAAACERGHCKPDGYGCYVRDGVKHGFFLEYDRGTESARKYSSKLHAYYRYRDSGAARRDYDGFPTVLFVTTEAGAEWRMADQAHRVWFTRSGEPLPILITTTDRIREHDEGVLGPIWRTPGSEAEVERRYWLTGGPPRGRSGQVSLPIPTPRLSWPTAGGGRRQGAPRVSTERDNGPL